MALGEIDHADRQRGPGGDAGLHVEPVVQRAAPRAPQAAPGRARSAPSCRRRYRTPAPSRNCGRSARRSPRRRAWPRSPASRSRSTVRSRARTRSMNSPLLAAMRHASVAISRDRVTAAPPHLVGADLERVDGAAHGGVGQPARAQHAFAETDDAGERVDDEKAAARGLGDQQPAIIGAEIERAINRMAPAPRGAPASFLPSAAARRPWAGASARARAATCAGPPPPQSPVSLRSALRSRETMAAGRASPLGPFTMFNLLTPGTAVAFICAVERPVCWSYAI